MSMSIHPAARRIVPGLAIAALLAVTTGHPARAEAPRTERVHAADLDLSRAADRSVLQRRIATAVEKLCAPPHSAVLPQVRSRRAVQACRNAAHQQVQQQLQRRGVPALTAARH